MQLDTNIENDFQQQWLVRKSWEVVTRKLETSQENFGFYVFQRVFERNPSLKAAFQVDHYNSLDLIPEEHSVFRHMRLFTNVISLAVSIVFYSISIYKKYKFDTVCTELISVLSLNYASKKVMVLTMEHSNEKCFSIVVVLVTVFGTCVK